ncbi:hypothetical protein KC19_2G145000 [Ceratodon purpureus]|uniref:Uncharacterized protein n=1 Tax=Ceratodon purpureus TaxID=3225 RepID=A0A8T0IWE9_CERPU|nr:hypothetical protein KC19_2G145000 [Ceratodon purpureus]
MSQTDTTHLSDREPDAVHRLFRRRRSLRLQLRGTFSANWTWLKLFAAEWKSI